MSNETSIDHFFDDTPKKFGYNVFGDPCGFYGLKAVAEKYPVEWIYSNKKSGNEIILNDSIFITATGFKYLEPSKKAIEWKGPIEFIYNNKRYKFIYLTNTLERFYK